MSKPIDIAASKIKGLEKSVEARGKGLTGVFQLLARQHAEAGALIDRATRDSTKRAALWPEIRIALLSHEHGELEAVYPALDRYDPLKPFVKRHADEAVELERTIERLDVLSPDSEEWGIAFATLNNLVRAHVAEEENEIFPAAITAMGTDAVKGIEGEYKTAQKTAQASLKKMKH